MSPIKELKVLPTVLSSFSVVYDNGIVVLEVIQPMYNSMYTSICDELVDVFGKENIQSDKPREIKTRTSRSSRVLTECRKQNVKMMDEHMQNIENAKKFGFVITDVKVPELPRCSNEQFYINDIQIVVGCKIRVKAPLHSETYNDLYVVGVFDVMYIETTPSAQLSNECEACGDICTEQFCAKCKGIIERLKSVSIHLSKCVRANVPMNSKQACLISTCDNHTGVGLTDSQLHAKDHFCTSVTGPASVGGLMTCHELTCKHDDSERTFNPQTCHKEYAWEDIRKVDGKVTLEYYMNVPPWVKRPNVRVTEENGKLMINGESIRGQKHFYPPMIDLATVKVCKNMACVSSNHMQGNRLMSDFCRSAKVIKRFAPPRENKICHDVLCQNHANSDISVDGCDQEYAW